MRAERALFGSWAASALGLLGVLVPKCPLCLAAYLCLFGFSAGTAHALATLGLPLCLGLLFISALATALFVARRGRYREGARTGTIHAPSRACCCPLARTLPTYDTCSK
jgi:hypothetical protein